MKFQLKIEGDALSLCISEADDTPQARGRACNKELALLRFYGSHTSEPVLKDEATGKLTFRYLRFGSDHKIYHGARRVLEGFAVKWIDGVNGRDMTELELHVANCKDGCVENFYCTVGLRMWEREQESGAVREEETSDG